MIPLIGLGCPVSVPKNTSCKFLKSTSVLYLIFTKIGLEVHRNILLLPYESKENQVVYS